MFIGLHAFRLRRVTALILLATYGSVGVLGYGLHALWHVHHHGQHHSHHSDLAQTGCCSGGCACQHSTCAVAVTPTVSVEKVGVLAAIEACQQLRKNAARQQTASFSELVLEGPCPICATLAQAQSGAATVTGGELVSSLHSEPPADEVLAPLYLPAEHLARGPPTC